MSIINFKQYINEVTTLKGSGPDALRHAKNYIEPYVGQEGTHTLKRSHGDLEAGSKVTVHGFEQHEGKYHAIVSGEGSSKKHSVPFSKIAKPKSGKENKGLAFESNVVNRLNQHGLMKGSGAGTTAGNDFHLINKKHSTIHKGKMSENITPVHHGETKENLKAAFGQASLKYHPEKGWHFDEKTKQRFPKYTSEIEKATTTVNGKKKSLLQHINDSYGAPNPEKKSSLNVYSDHTDLKPMHSYLHDHHVDVLHVGTHGTFRAGRSEKKDSTGVGLPEAEGEGRFRVRQKHPNSLTVQFNVKKLNKSNINLENDKDLAHIKKVLGHE